MIKLTNFSVIKRIDQGQITNQKNLHHYIIRLFECDKLQLMKLQKCVACDFHQNFFWIFGTEISEVDDIEN